MEAHTMVWERAAILSVEIFRLILWLYRHSIIFRAALSLLNCFKHFNFPRVSLNEENQ